MRSISSEVWLLSVTSANVFSSMACAPASSISLAKRTHPPLVAPFKLAITGMPTASRQRRRCSK